MDDVEAQRQSFVVIVWLEEAPSREGRAVWRGHITHVPSGERRYVTTLDDVPAFIAPYLQRMGVTLNLKWHVCLWLRRFRRSMV
ncbi:MAG: hypothetical protein ACRDIY_08675, partial [Chloroflexota bacterium]